MNVPSLPPAILLDPRPVDRPWGGERVGPRFGWSQDNPVGEWWLASTYPGSETTVRNTGMDLSAWLDRPEAQEICKGSQNFPVLLKFLDCKDVLSVQVHPDDTVARSHGLPRGKTEAWFVVDCEEGAGVYLGTQEGVSGQDLLEIVAAGGGNQAVRDALRFIEVTPGDTLLVPAGSVHAIGPGLVLFEVQQNSDTTYRIYDWGRGRPVHIKESKDALLDHPQLDPIQRETSGDHCTLLLDDPAFAVMRARPDHPLSLQPRHRFCTLTVLAGQGHLAQGDTTLPLVPGDTALVLAEVSIEGDGLDLLAIQPTN